MHPWIKVFLSFFKKKSLTDPKLLNGSIFQGEHNFPQFYIDNHNFSLHTYFIAIMTEQVSHTSNSWLHSAIMCASPWVAARFSFRSFWSGLPVAYFLWIDLNAIKDIMCMSFHVIHDIFTIFVAVSTYTKLLNQWKKSHFIHLYEVVSWCSPTPAAQSSLR